MEETSRLPEWVQWPMFEDCAPVRVGDGFADELGNPRTVTAVELKVTEKGCDARVFWGEPWSDAYLFVRVWQGERVKRAPVLAADGEPLEVGQTVWHTKTGAEYRVLSLPDGEKGAWLGNSDGKYFLDYAVLTHQRPVLAADGVPIRVGDTVYLLPGEWCGEYPLRYYSAGDEMVVKELCPDHQHEGVLRCVGDGKCNCFPLPYQLTHTKPEPTDSLERIADEIDRLREDVAQHLGDYMYDEDGNDSIQFSMELVAKRCRALAERGQ